MIRRDETRVDVPRQGCWDLAFHAKARQGMSLLSVRYVLRVHPTRDR